MDILTKPLEIAGDVAGSALESLNPLNAAGDLLGAAGGAVGALTEQVPGLSMATDVLSQATGGIL